MRRDNMDVLKEIKKEHDEFKSLISKIENSKGEEKKSLFRELYAKIKGHHEAEERIVFPDVKKKSDEEGKDVVREMIEEHSLAVYQFSVIEKTSIDNDTWDAKFSVLKEVLTHHMDEEEQDLFEQARKVLNKKDLEEKYGPFESTMDEYKKIQEKKLK
jgi:hemerythrin superfamily protein